MLYFLIALEIINRVYGVTPQCATVDVKTLMEGCDRLLGLNITSIGGTMVNDHNCDVLLPKQVFLEEPLFQYPLADSKKFYTIFMLDPDAPPRIEGEFFLHMLKSNIPGLALKAKETSKTVGIDYRGYKPPTPPRDTGAHRYVSLLYEQSDGNNFLPNVPSSRNRFHLANWLRGKSLCGPVAATQFRVQF
ncbi:phosphatidylethanolamine-binding protein 4-like [Pararge aegeria]|uniref:phosphatidylethanolamine-binding protein 4-like n=1 Tax=Pararge aegeria TaxID=116150 RepID=UPI0019D2B0F3|nr:phosphatidylethanolamine-binding protein 4-like [Pararge aegeria]XP_039755131.1 phosphatidylethanolamine-binding protein 4-like [Pararge aegeria]